MKNVLIVIALGCAAYGAYLWMGKKKEDEEDCGCGGTAAASSTPSAFDKSVQPVAVNTDLMPDNAVEQYNTSFNKIFIGRGNSSFPIGAASTDDTNAGIVTETAI